MQKELTQTLIKKIIDEKKISKYRLAKNMKVSWNTIQMWYRGVFEANEKNRKKLKIILKSKIENAIISQ